ncbi:hypothetical protein KSD_04520 [Ktedonobacter sp. SOSP1-85]|nr:hypothetical protein KSD_04520 [Ktedonobacter sp. SOSP1-85]
MREEDLGRSLSVEGEESFPQQNISSRSQVELRAKLGTKKCEQNRSFVPSRAMTR